jgi:von Willebrand factor type A domain
VSASIPFGETAALVRPGRRTLAVRVALAAALAGALAAAWIAAQPGGKHVGLLPRGRSPIVAIDMSWSVSYDDYAMIERTLTDLVGSGRRIGLVLFSDIAYEALPPGTPASELRPYLRFFAKRGVRNPWADAFSGGTRIWAGLDLARRMLQRDRISNGSVVLISDLADAPNDRPLLGQTLASFARDSIPIKIVGLDPTPEDADLFRGALAHGGGSVTTLDIVEQHARRSRSAAFPFALVVAAASLALLLGLNEHALAALSFGRRRPS